MLIGNPSVDHVLRDRVLAAADDMDYRFNPMARALRTRSTTVVGLVIPDIENPFFTALARGVEDVMAEARYSVMLCNSDEALDQEERYLRDLSHAFAAGVIVAPASEQETDLSDLLERSIPVVAVDRRCTRHRIDSVSVNNAYGASLAAAYLVDRCGARSPAIVSGPQRTSTGAARLDGFLDALQERGIDLPPDRIVQGHHRVRGGFEAIERLWSQPTPLDGLFVANNLMAVGALRALGDLGLAVPDDVAVTCFDDVPAGANQHVPIPIVRQPARSMGITAGELLLDRLEGRAAPPRQIVLDPVWVEDPGSSTFGSTPDGSRARTHS